MGRLGSVRVLLVEDDAQVREAFADFLREEGAVVCCAASGSEALVQFEIEAPHILLSDLSMADGDGFEMIARVRSLGTEKGGLVPAIALSALEHTERALLSGFHAFVRKPFNPTEVVETIADFTIVSGEPQRVAPWTIRRKTDGAVAITLAGRLRAPDMHAMMRSLLLHLQEGPCDVVADSRRLSGFSPAIPSIGERAVWRFRHNVRSVRVVGATLLAKVVSMTACRLLGIPCEFVQDA